MTICRDNLEAKFNLLVKAANGEVGPIMREDPRWSIGLAYVEKLRRERNTARCERNENLKEELAQCQEQRDEARQNAASIATDYRGVLMERDNARQALDLIRTSDRIGNSGHKRAFAELELAFNRMREFLYPETVGENGQ